MSRRTTPRHGPTPFSTHCLWLRSVPPVCLLLRSLTSSGCICVRVSVCNFEIWPKYATRWTLSAISNHIPRWSPCQHTRRSTHPDANVPLILLTHSSSVESQGAGESPGRERHCTPPPHWDLIEETSAWYKVKLLGSLWHKYRTSGGKKNLCDRQRTNLQNRIVSVGVHKWRKQV